MKNLKLSLFALLLPLHANALSVNTMLLEGDIKGNSTFSLTNNYEYTEYITAKITKYDVQGVRIIETPYDETNLQDWEITLTHPKLILEAGRTKPVGIRSLCSTGCNFDKEHVYKVHFIPSPYAEGEGDASGVSMSIGYAPLFIIPPANPRMEISLRNDGDKLYVNNTGNAFVRVALDNCSVNDQAEQNISCRTGYTVLAGRETSFPIPEAVRNNEIKAAVIGNKEKFFRNFVLNQGQLHKESD